MKVFVECTEDLTSELAASGFSDIQSMKTRNLDGGDIWTLVVLLSGSHTLSILINRLFDLFLAKNISSVKIDGLEITNISREKAESFLLEKQKNNDNNK